MAQDIGRRAVITTATVGLVGVVVGAVLTAVLNFYLQRAAERRRWNREDERQKQLWEREDQTRFQADRLRLYRDFLVEAQRARNLEGFNEEQMERMAVELELISGSSNVVMPAMALLYDTKDLWTSYHQGGDEAATLHKWERDFYKFNQAAQDELSIPQIAYRLPEKPQELPETVAKHPGEPRPATGGAQEPTERMSWWRRMFGA